MAAAATNNAAIGRVLFIPLVVLVVLVVLLD
jgi:hypothetical protein